MNLREIFKKSGDKEPELYTMKGAVYSMSPPETLFGATYHAHMIPCFRPQTVLILGYGMGTVAQLIRMVWGAKVKITGVDTNPGTYKLLEHRLVVGDAYDYVKSCTTGIIKTRYDYICVDLYDDNVQIPEFVFQVEFVVRLREMCKNMICLNVTEDTFKKCNNYKDYGFEFERFVPIDAQRVSHWSVIDGD